MTTWTKSCLNFSRGALTFSLSYKMENKRMSQEEQGEKMAKLGGQTFAGVNQKKCETRGYRVVQQIRHIRTRICTSATRRLRHFYANSCTSRVRKWNNLCSIWRIFQQLRRTCWKLAKDEAERRKKSQEEKKKEEKTTFYPLTDETKHVYRVVSR